MNLGKRKKECSGKPIGQGLPTKGNMSCRIDNMNSLGERKKRRKARRRNKQETKTN